MTPGREIPVPAFQFTTARTGAVRLSFTGRHRIPDGATLRIDGADIVVDRGEHLPLRFSGLSEQDRRRLEVADCIQIKRSFPGGDDYLSEVWLEGRRPRAAAETGGEVVLPSEGDTGFDGPRRNAL